MLCLSLMKPHDHHRRLRANLRDLFLTNQVSAERASSLLTDAHGAGVETLDDVAHLHQKGSRNVHRDLLRKFVKKGKALAQSLLGSDRFLASKEAGGAERMACLSAPTRMALQISQASWFF